MYDDSYQHSSTAAMHGRGSWFHRFVGVLCWGEKTCLRGIGSILAAVSADELLITVASSSIKREADCDGALWCIIITEKSTLTIGLVYRSPNINKDDNVIKKVNKWECIIMGDFNNGHIQRKCLENRGVNTKHFYS